MRLNEHIIAPIKEAFPVKKIRTTQSRRNIKTRKAKVVARHGKAGVRHKSGGVRGTRELARL